MFRQTMTHIETLCNLLKIDELQSVRYQFLWLQQIGFTPNNIVSITRLSQHQQWIIPEVRKKVNSLNKSRQTSNAWRKPNSNRNNTRAAIKTVVGFETEIQISEPTTSSKNQNKKKTKLQFQLNDKTPHTHTPKIESREKKTENPPNKTIRIGAPQPGLPVIAPHGHYVWHSALIYDLW